MKKMKMQLLLFIAAWLFAACDNIEPNKAFVGVWEPVGYEDCDQFVITSDSIKAITCDTKQEHYQCHYKKLAGKRYEIERCWLNDLYKTGDYKEDPYYIGEVQMYIDREKYLIIRDFLPETESALSQNYPNYKHLKLRKL